MSAHPLSAELRALPLSFAMCDSPEASVVILAAADALDAAAAANAEMRKALEFIDECAQPQCGMCMSRVRSALTRAALAPKETE